MGAGRKIAGFGLFGWGAAQGVASAFALTSLFTGAAAGSVTFGTAALVTTLAVAPPALMMWGGSALMSGGSAPAPAPAK